MTMKRFFNRSMPVAALVVASFGIGTFAFSGASVADAMDADSHMATSSAPQLSDANIAAIVVEADTIDINNGKLALKKSHDPRVRAFAKEMIRDHSAINKAAVKLVKKLGVKPEPSDLSRSLEASARKTMTRLSKLHGKAFDRAYTNNEVAYHKLVIQTAKTALIPDAQNPELKQTLVKTAPVFEAHLHHAEWMQRQEMGMHDSMKHGM
jgi:putative membrane protein